MKLRKADYDIYRRPDGSLNLVQLYRTKFGNPPSTAAAKYLKGIDADCYIKSTQVALIALNTARTL